VRAYPARSPWRGEVRACSTRVTYAVVWICCPPVETSEVGSRTASRPPTAAATATPAVIASRQRRRRTGLMCRCPAGSSSERAAATAARARTQAPVEGPGVSSMKRRSSSISSATVRPSSCRVSSRPVERPQVKVETTELLAQQRPGPRQPRPGRTRSDLKRRRDLLVAEPGPCIQWLSPAMHTAAPPPAGHG